MKSTRPISDEEFDKLFQDKLFSIEVEPTDVVWEGITDMLNAAPGERTFPILRIAAARLAAMVGLGIWLAATKEPMKLHVAAASNVDVRPVGNIAAKVSENSYNDVKSTAVAAVIQPEALAVRSVQAKSVSVASDPNFKNDEITSQPVASHKAGAVTDGQLLTEAKSDVKAVETVSEQKHVDILAAVSSEELSQPDGPRMSPKISTPGGLVNFVVSKVDRRKNKIIEFEEGEEGTIVSGINLGLIKFRAKQ